MPVQFQHIRSQIETGWLSSVNAIHSPPAKPAFLATDPNGKQSSGCEIDEAMKNRPHSLDLLLEKFGETRGGQGRRTTDEFSPSPYAFIGSIHPKSELPTFQVPTMSEKVLWWTGGIPTVWRTDIPEPTRWRDQLGCDRHLSLRNVRI